MKYPASEYAKFLLSLKHEPDHARLQKIKKLATLLDKNGDIKDWRKIAETYSAMRAKADAGKTAKVTYSGQIDKEAVRKELSPLAVEFVEDSRLMGGARVEIGDTRHESTIAGRLADFKKQLNF